MLLHGGRPDQRILFCPAPGPPFAHQSIRAALMASKDMTDFVQGRCIGDRGPDRHDPNLMKFLAGGGVKHSPRIFGAPAPAINNIVPFEQGHDVPVHLLVHHVDFGPASFPAAPLASHQAVASSASAPAFRQGAARTYSAARPTSSSTRAARTSAWIRNSAIMG
jgi:hypothetical protein